jgi:hypothetical protein
MLHILLLWYHELCSWGVFVMYWSAIQCIHESNIWIIFSIIPLVHILNAMWYYEQNQKTDVDPIWVELHIVRTKLFKINLCAFVEVFYSLFTPLCCFAALLYMHGWYVKGFFACSLGLGFVISGLDQMGYDYGINSEFCSSSTSASVVC